MHELTSAETQLFCLIRKAFQGVELGAGRGLREAHALDDYADESTCAEPRIAPWLEVGIQAKAGSATYQNDEVEDPLRSKSPPPLELGIEPL